MVWVRVRGYPWGGTGVEIALYVVEKLLNSKPFIRKQYLAYKRERDLKEAKEKENIEGSEEKDTENR